MSALNTVVADKVYDSSGNLLLNRSTKQEDRRYRLLGKLIGADMNSTADQAIPIDSTRYTVARIIVEKASANLTTAAGGVYDAASKGGNAIVANTQAYSALSASTKRLNLTLATVGTTDVLVSPNLYLSLTTGQGSAATANVWVYGEDLMEVPN